MQDISALLIILLAFHIYCDEIKTVRVKCDTQCRQCGSGYCVHLINEQSDLDIIVCVQASSCTASLNFESTLQKCNVNYRGESCPSRLCYSAPNIPVCRYGSTKCTSDPELQVVITCQTICGDNAGCPSCFEATQENGEDYYFCDDSLTDQNGEKCDGLTADQKYNIPIQRCPSGKDIFGIQCTCCSTISTPFLRYCTQQSQIMISSELNNWYLHGTTFQLKDFVRFGLMGCMLVIFAFFY